MTPLSKWGSILVQDRKCDHVFPEPALDDLHVHLAPSSTQVCLGVWKGLAVKDFRQVASRRDTNRQTMSRGIEGLAKDAAFQL